MAARTWNSAASTDMNDGANYTGAGALLTTDDLTFDNTSVVNATATAALSVASITVATTYTGTWNDAGYAIQTTGAMTFDPTGAFTTTGAHTITGDASYHVGSTVTTWTCSSSLDLKGTGNLDIDETMSVSIAFVNITCAYTGKTTTVIGAVNTYYTGTLTLSGGGMSWTGGLGQFHWVGSGVATPVVRGSSSLSVATTPYNTIFYFQPQGASTISLDFYSTRMNPYVYDCSGVLVTYDLIGAFGGCQIRLYSVSSSTGTLVFDTKNYGWSWRYDGDCSVNLTTGTCTSNWTIKFGSSSVGTGLFSFGRDAGATLALELGTSVINTYSTLNIAGCSSIDCGTSTINLCSSGASAFYPGTHVFYTVIENKTGAGSVTLYTALSCNTFQIIDGPFNTAGYALTTAGSITIDGNDIITLTGSTITITGDGNFHLGSTISGSSVYTNCSLVVQGTGAIDLDKSGVILYSMTLSAASKTTTITGDGVGVGTVFLTIGAGNLVISITDGFFVAPSTTCSPIVNNAASIVCTTGWGVIKTLGGDVTLTLPAITMTGGGEFDIGNLGETGSTSIINMNGNISCDGAVYIYTLDNTLITTFNTNNFSVTSGALIVNNYPNGTPNTFTVNFGSSTVVCSSFTALFLGVESGTVNFNMGSSQWTCSGSWMFGTTYTVNAGTSQVTFSNVTGASTITSSGKSFYTVIINNNHATLGYTLVDALSCNTFQVTDGAFSTGGFALTTVGSTTIDGDNIITLTGSTITMTGDGNFHIGVTISASSALACNVDLKGTGNLDMDFGQSVTTAFVNITCAYSGKVSAFTGTPAVYWSGVLTITDVLTVSANGIYWCGSGVVTPIVNGGTGTFSGGDYYTVYFKPQGAATVSLPTLAVDAAIMGGAKFYDFTNVTVTYNMTGNFWCNVGATSNCDFTSIGAGNNVLVFNTNNYSFKCGCAEGSQTAGSNTSSFTWNWGSSAVTIYRYGFGGGDAGATSTFNMGTSQWTISNTYFYAWGLTAINCGTSTITFTSNGASALYTSSTHTFYNIVVDKSGGSFSQEGNLICNSLTVSGTTTFQQTGTLTFATDATFDCTGNVILNYSFTMTGNGTFRLGAGIGAGSSVASCALELQGSCIFDIDKSGLTFLSVKFNKDGGTIQSTGAADWATGRWYVEPGTSVVMAAGRTVTVTTVNAGDIDGTAGNLVTFTSSVPGTYWNYGNPATAQAANYVSVTDSNASNPINPNTSNCVNGGHNYNWVFAAIIIGSGILSSILSLMDGTGINISYITGTGNLTSSPPLIAGFGLDTHIGAGELESITTTISGSGIDTSDIIGLGNLQSQLSQVSGYGINVNFLVGTGNLISISSLIAGFGLDTLVGAGELRSVAAVISGSGMDASDLIGLGNLVAANAFVLGTGTGTSELLGSGSLITGSSNAEGSGDDKSNLIGSGHPESKSSLISGAGSDTSHLIGSGNLISTESLTSGTGNDASFLIGAGALITSRPSVSGNGLSLSFLVGSGDLLCVALESLGGGQSKSQLVGSGSLNCTVPRIRGRARLYIRGKGIILSVRPVFAGHGRVSSHHPGQGKELRIMGLLNSDFLIHGLLRSDIQVHGLYNSFIYIHGNIDLSEVEEWES